MLRFFTAVVVISIACHVTAWLPADEPSPSVAPPLRDREFALLATSLAEYKIVSEAEGEASLKLLSDPILRWSNPLRGASDGGVFLWTRSQRPAVIACVFWRDQGQLKHELHSFVQQKLTATASGESVWTPSSGGLDWRPLDVPATVAANRAQRLVQMRRIASSFEAKVINVVKGDDRGELLRLQPQPLYRNPEQAVGDGVMDGAIFSFVQATDPESLLLVEARSSPAQEPTWHVAWARMSKFAQVVSRDGAEFWRCGSTNGDLTDQNYFVRTINAARPTE